MTSYERNEFIRKAIFARLHQEWLAIVEEETKKARLEKPAPIPTGWAGGIAWRGDWNLVRILNKPLMVDS